MKIDLYWAENLEVIETLNGCSTDKTGSSWNNETRNISSTLLLHQNTIFLAKNSYPSSGLRSCPEVGCCWSGLTLLQVTVESEWYVVTTHLHDCLYICTHPCLNVFAYNPSAGTHLGQTSSQRCHSMLAPWCNQCFQSIPQGQPVVCIAGGCLSVFWLVQVPSHCSLYEKAISMETFNDGHYCRQVFCIECSSTNPACLSHQNWLRRTADFGK